MPQSNSINIPVSKGQYVRDAIASAAVRTGVSFDYLYNQARVESGFNPQAHANSSSARGLYQFTDQTWLSTLKQHGDDHGLGWAASAISVNDRGHYRIDDPKLTSDIYGLRDDAVASANMAAEFASDNTEFLSNALGRSPDQVDLYIAHFLGAGGAAQFLKNHDAHPDAPAAPVFQKAAAANNNIFYTTKGQPRSFAEIRANFARKLGSGDRSNPPSQVTKRIISNDHKNSFAMRQLENVPAMMTITPMPKRLSLEFAHTAYARLSKGLPS